MFEDMDFFTWLEDFALPKDMAYEPRHQRAGSLLCQAEMIANGTTCFIDIFRFPAESAAVAVDSGLRATISPQAVDTPAGAGETLESSEAFIDAWHGRHPRVRAWFGPHSLYTVDAATYTAMRERADQLGVGIHTHLAETRGEVERVAELSGGLTPAAWLPPPDRPRPRRGGRPLHRAHRRRPGAGGFHRCGGGPLSPRPT